MAVTARIKKDGELLTLGEIDELTPAVTDGLVAYWPLDGGNCGGVTLKERNLLNYRTWSVGTVGPQPGFDVNGDANENSIVLDYDPFGAKTAIWQATPKVIGDADGGWNTTRFPIDPTKTYRVSVWIRRKVIGAGTAYHGVCWYGNDQVLELSNAASINPYFEIGPVSTTEWRLYVGHIWKWSKSDTAVHPDTGIYTRKGKVEGGTDYKWWQNATTGACRSFLFYCGDPTTVQQFCYPRFEVVSEDGTEPSIAQLLRGEGYSLEPSVCRNIVFDGDGVAVDGQSNNLAPWGNFASQSFGTDEGTATILPRQGVNGRNAVRIYKSPGMTYGNWQARNSVSVAVSAGDTFTASVKYKAQEGCGFSVGDWSGPNGNIPTWPVTSDVDVGDGWRRRTSSITYAAAGSIPIFGINSTTPGKWVIFSDLQLDKKPFCPAFSDSGHSYGELSLPAKGFLEASGSISFEFFQEARTSQETRLLDNGVRAPRFEAFLDSAGVLSLRAAGYSETVAGGDAAAIGQWHSAMVSWTPSAIGISLDGGEFHEIPFDMSAQIAGSTVLRVGYFNPTTSSQYVKFRNVCVYSKDVSPKAKTIAKSKATAMRGGKLSARKMIEGKIVRSDWLYFPLGSDALDITRQIGPTRESNLAFEDSSLWVGTPTVNLSSNGSWLFTNNGGTIADFGNSGPNGTRRWTFMKTGSASQWHGWESGLTGNFPAGSKFTASFYSKNETLGQGWSVCAYTGNWSRNLSNWASGAYNRGPAWKKHVATITFLESCTSFVTADGPSWNYNAKAGSVDFAGLMWETKGFASPFCRASRGSGALAYNLYASYGLDWSKDWTIAYWKKPVATHADNDAGYSIDSIGANSGTGNSGTGNSAYYAWWGKQNGQNDVVGPRAVSTGSWGTYLGKWQFVALRKRGQSIDMEIRGHDFTAKSTTSSVPTSQSACVNSMPGWNYDLMLGGFDNANPMNSYYRDLVVAKYALTDAEIDTLCAQARLIKDGINVPCAFEEGLR